MEHILDNAYTNRDFEYLKSKNVEVCIIIQHKVTKEISMRSSVPLIDVKSMLQKTDRDKEQSQWVSEHQRKYFPKSDGPITNVFNNKGKLIVMASKVMCFWKEVRGGQAMARSLKSTTTRPAVGGPKTFWEDQRAGDLKKRSPTPKFT